MLRRSEQNGCAFYISPLLLRAGVPHAFSTRIGGVSRGRFESLNLGNPSDSEIKDSSDNIATNYRRLHDAIGCAARTRCFVHQVHGCAVADASGENSFANNQPADALVSNDPTKLLAVRTADCVPILLATDDGRFVAAVHAGWRGVIANVLRHASDELLRIAGSNSAKLIGAIGPCISQPHFEVGPEVLDQFDQRFGPRAAIERSSTGKGRVDLARAAALQLIEAGLSPDDIDTTDRCTFRDADEFFSHRREHGVTGRMAALIGVRDDAPRNL